MRRVLEKYSRNFKPATQWQPVLSSKLLLQQHSARTSDNENFKADSTFLSHLRSLQSKSVSRKRFCDNVKQLPLLKLRTLVEDLQRTTQLEDVPADVLRDVWQSVGAAYLRMITIPPSAAWKPTAYALEHQRTKTKDYNASAPGILSSSEKQPRPGGRDALWLLDVLRTTPKILSFFPPQMLIQLLGTLLATLPPRLFLSHNDVNNLVRSVGAINRILADYGDVQSCALAVGNEALDALPLDTIITRVIGRCCDRLVAFSTVPQLLRLARALLELPLYHKGFLKELTRQVPPSAAQLDTHVLLTTLEVLNLYKVVDLQVISAIASEIMLHRIDAQLTPREVCRFISALAVAGVLYPYVYDAGFRSLLRFSASELREIDWLVNRSQGRVPDKNGRWVPKSLLGKPGKPCLLTAHIGDEDSKVFVGLECTMMFRRDAELSESLFYRKLLYDQLTMSPEASIRIYPNTPLSDFSYPLLAASQFEAALKISSNRNHLASSELEEASSGTLPQMIAELFRALRSVDYYEETLVRFFAELVVCGATKPHVSAVSRKRRADVTLYQNASGLINAWSLEELYNVSRALFACKVWFPKKATFFFTMKVFRQFATFNGQQIGAYLLDFVQAPSGLSRCSETVEVSSELLKIPQYKLWEMDAYGLASWLIACSYLCPRSQTTPSPTLPCDEPNNTPPRHTAAGWAVSSTVETVFEILVQKLYSIHCLNARSLKGTTLPLVSHRFIPGFTWNPTVWSAEHQPEVAIATSEAAAVQNVNTFPPLTTCNLSEGAEVALTQSGALATQNVAAQNCDMSAWNQPASSKNKTYLEALAKQLETKETRFTHSDTTDITVNVRGTPITPQEGLSEKDQITCGFTKYDLEGPDGDLHDAALSKSLAAASTRLVWTAILTYLILDDVEEVSATGDVFVLSWEKGLHRKLEVLSTKSLAHLHDILLLCSREARAWASIEDNKSLQEEARANPKLIEAIKKYITTYGVEDIEKRYLELSEIQEFITAAIEQGVLPPSASSFLSQNAPLVPAANSTNNPLVQMLAEKNAINLNCASSNQPNDLCGKAVRHQSLYKHLNKLLPEFYDHFYITTQDPHQPPDVVKICSRVPLGPLELDFTVTKVLKCDNVH